MKILAIDTTTNTLCLGVYDDGKVYAYSLESGRKLSGLLMATIKNVLDALELKPSEIDYLACGVGPGSFTGLRVGLSTIKGLAFSLNKPIVAVPTLDILAENAEGFNSDYIIPAIDAKRNLIFCSIYKRGNKGIKRVSPYMLLSENEFVSKIKNKALVLGDALNLYQQSLSKRAKNAVLLDKDYWKLNPANLLALSLQRIKKREVTDTFKVKPIYLYPQECQVKK
ncbi:MAG: tRNA (adenosine(37)-N6)-threonylcarbamoyltransferase complex dimerization subunit type 1 TsaB [Candidatus Omnitrophica bacterium]|nr:tRNA (adenosine(37)-N6)-threonylcarbamoyltransferase complex dimerization subunit type 1 TsaB [Candidatus Omnitrophota bacterium]MDD5653224.1 tRNA (adenosine(37)-N6)-threonylcarbamoyltransferase complex dimerization subunit type 1 TsaB [Candidatus Omnitrophota bacterium]